MTAIPVSKYCQACGNGLIESAAICPKCGTPVPGHSIPGTASTKSKTTAVVLAVFLSYWTWLYTYSVNAAKFWTALGAGFFLFIIQMATYSASYSASSFTGVTVFAWIVGIGFWIWAIVDNASRPESFFTNLRK
jgi:amino acid transporter